MRSLLEPTFGGLWELLGHSWEGKEHWNKRVCYYHLDLVLAFFASERLWEPSWEGFGPILAPSGAILGQFFRDFF